MLNKLVRIGRDAELRTTSSGHSVVGLACVYDIGFGDKKKPQWLEAVIWGKQAEALAPFLLKGAQVVIYADDVELETFTKGDGSQGSKLKCRVVNIDLTDKKDNQAPRQAPQQQRQAPPAQQAPQNNQVMGNNNGFEDDLIPF